MTGDKYFDAYFNKLVDPTLRLINDNDEKANFLGDELTKFELCEQKLAQWALRNDGSPNPFSPPLDRDTLCQVLAGLNSRLDIVTKIRADGGASILEAAA